MDGFHSYDREKVPLLPLLTPFHVLKSTKEKKRILDETFFMV